MNMRDRIPVAFTPDENFVIQTAVAIISMLRSKRPETNYYFYLVVSSKIDRKPLHYFEDVKRLYQDFEYEIVYIDSSQFDNLLITTEHLSTSAYYRLMLPIILPGEDKVMYHDGDILVTDDLADMYDVDLTGKYIAGIPSINAIQDSEWKDIHISQFGFKSMEGYIFSGDLVLNLKAMREDGMCRRFAQTMKLGLPSEDQDVLNYCCRGSIHFLPLRYCVLSRWVNNNSLFEFEKNLYSENEIIEAQKHPAVIHYAGPIAKPWANTRAVLGKYWWSIAEEFLDGLTYRKMLELAETKTVERDFQTLRGHIDRLLADKYKGIVIYGAGKAGKALLEQLKNSGAAVYGFIDKTEKMVGNRVDGVMVYSFDTVMELGKENLFIISVQNNSKSIERSLLEAGLSSEQILHYYFKEKIYLNSIDLEYKEFEYQDCGISGEM